VWIFEDDEPAIYDLPGWEMCGKKRRVKLKP
jgi:hypothetical protein